MGFWSEVACPACGTRGARKLLWKIKCPNRACVHADMELMHEVESRPQPPPPRGSFNPGPNALSIRYRNSRGEEKTFVVDRTSARFGGKHLSFRAAPTGKRIALERARILNASELPSPRPRPTAVEAQIMGFYSRPGRSSPRCDELRRKYPDWGRAEA